jgi:hypothetical protein
MTFLVCGGSIQHLPLLVAHISLSLSAWESVKIEPEHMKLKKMHC